MVKILNCYLYAKKSYGTLSKGEVFLANPVCSEFEFMRPSVSELENCGLVESSTEVAAVVAGYVGKKESKDSTCLDCRKCIIFNPEAESHSAFECFEYLLVLSHGGLMLPASDLTQYVC